VEIVKSGHAGLSQVNWDDRAFFAYDDLTNDIVGAVSYSLSDWDRTCYVRWAYVLPEYRRHGLHTSMVVRIEKKAIEGCCVKMSRSTHVDNEVTQRSIESQGYVPKMISFEKRLVTASSLLRTDIGKVQS
jgi:GNAT superfamily N-acetyltransferase